MSRQKRFTPRDYRTDPDYLAFVRKFRRTRNLEHAVLLGHVMIEDQLQGLLAARLGTDTLPNLRGFELICGLALAGTKAKHPRDVAEYLNAARNDVGHRMTRKAFDDNVERFVRAVKGKSGKTMKWPSKEADRVGELRIAAWFFMVAVTAAIEYEDEVHRLGTAAMDMRRAAPTATPRSASRTRDAEIH